MEEQNKIRILKTNLALTIHKFKNIPQNLFPEINLSTETKLQCYTNRLTLRNTDTSNIFHSKTLEAMLSQKTNQKTNRSVS